MSQKVSQEEFKRLFELWNEMKRKRPDFVRQESWRYVRVKENWRKPKGIDSKMRLQVKGWPPIVKVGYRSPKLVRGLHPSGKKEVIIHNVEELLSLNPEQEVARIAGGVGRRKRIEILEKAKQLGIRVVNPRRAEPKVSKE